MMWWEFACQKYYSTKIWISKGTIDFHTGLKEEVCLLARSQSVKKKIPFKVWT